MLKKVRDFITNLPNVFLPLTIALMHAAKRKSNVQEGKESLRFAAFFGKERSHVKFGMLAPKARKRLPLAFGKPFHKDADAVLRPGAFGGADKTGSVFSAPARKNGNQAAVLKGFRCVIERHVRHNAGAEHDGRLRGDEAVEAQRVVPMERDDLFALLKRFR